MGLSKYKISKYRCALAILKKCILMDLFLWIPASAPTSFEGPFGKVLHQVKAVIETPRFSKDHKCHKVFYVLCPLNLNDIPEIEVRGWAGSGWCVWLSLCSSPKAMSRFPSSQQPNTTSITKKFSYKLVKSGNVVLTVTTDLKGYVVGQAIQLRTDIENKSGRDTGTIVAGLIQVIHMAPYGMGYHTCLGSVSQI